jgi:two-component system sensor histidine kinase/response regulator
MEAGEKSRAMRDKRSKILAVDDTTDNLFIMQAILSEEGYCVSTSSNGLDALAKVKESPWGGNNQAETKRE